MTPIPGPLILLVLPLLASGVAYLVRRWAILAALLSSATAGVLAILCLRLPLDRSAFVLGQEVAFGRPVVILGRNLVLDPASQVWLAFVFALAGFLYLLAWRVSQGRSFFSFSLALLSLYALIALLQTFSLGVLVFAISTALAVLIIQGEQRDSVQGAQRFLLVTLLAVPFLLAAAWFVDQSVIDPEAVDIARRALLPAALGFGLLLAVFPFGTWMPALAASAPPLVTAFIFTAGQAMAVWLALAFLRDNPLALNHPATRSTVQLAGLLMAASGGIMAAVQRDLGRLFGYAALSNLGILLLTFGAGGSQSLILTLLHMINRAVCITLLAASLAILRQRVATDRLAELQGMARRLPIATIGLAVGGLALAGFPLTAGFATQWAVYRDLSGQHWGWVLILLASSAGIVIGLLRGLNAMLGADPRKEGERQPIIASLMIVGLVSMVVVLGLYPQLFLEPLWSAAQALRVGIGY